MHRARFEDLSVLRREWECRTGCSEICAAQNGGRHIRIRLHTGKIQQIFLEELGAHWPARLEDGALELLLPDCSGVSLRQWLLERAPSLGARRDACLALLSQLIEEQMPPCLLVPSAVEENLMLTEQGARLRYLPDLSQWQKDLAQAQSVCAVALLVRRILTEQTGSWQKRCFPEELQLLCIRAEQADYLDWSQLQSDLAALPEELPQLGAIGQRVAQRVRLLVRRFSKPILGLLAAALLLLAVLSLASAVGGWRNEQRSVWPGMTPVGDQELNQEQEAP